MTQSLPPTPAQSAGASAGPASPARPPILDHLEHGAHAAITHLADGAAEQYAQASKTLSQATQSMQHQSAAWRDSGEEWAECVRATVREQPLTSLATAFALGLVISRLGR